MSSCTISNTFPTHPAAPAGPGGAIRALLLATDRAAFDDFWELDDDGLRQAARATPSSQLRIGPSRAPTGYALFGRAGNDGYVQRLAVHPEAQGDGLGRALLADGLRWLQRRGAVHAYVNTQSDNDRAYGLYCASGFTPMPIGLCVLGRAL